MTITLKLNPARIVIALVSIGVAIAGIALFLRPTTKAAPEFLNYQGTLANNAGQPLPNGPHQLVFNIYDTAQPGGGEQHVWGPFPAQAEIVQGRFNVVLGPADTAPVPRSLKEAFQGDGDRFIEIKVDGGAAILPRQQFLSTPYAVRAHHADNGVPIGTVMDWWRPDNTFEVPGGFKICNGQTIVDPGGPFDGVVLPDLVDKLVKGVGDPDVIGEEGGSPTAEGTPILAGNPAEIPTDSDTHSHRWANWFYSSRWWKTWDANGAEQTIFNHTLNGVSLAGGNFSPMGRDTSTSSNFQYYTKPHTHSHTVPFPQYVGLLKIIKYK